jgi:hypothetical protein
VLATALALGLASPARAQAPAPAPLGPAAKPAPLPAPPPPAPPPAAPPAKPGAKPDDEAGRIIVEAQKAVKAAHWEEARVLYARALRLKPSFPLGIELARAEIGAEKFRDAAEHLTQTLADAPADLPDADRKVIEGLLAQARSKLGVLHFKIHPNGAEIVVNEQVVGTAPLDTPIFVDPGTVEVSARAEGFTGMRSQRAVAAGGDETFDLVLHRAGHWDPPPAKASGVDVLFQGVSIPILLSGAAATGALAILGGALAIVSDLKSSTSHSLEAPTAGCATTCATQFNSLQKQKVNFAGGAMWSFIGAGAVLLGTGAYWTVTVITTPRPVKAGLLVAPDRAAASLTYQW